MREEITGWSTLLRVGAPPPPGKSWIHLCSDAKSGRFFFLQFLLDTCIFLRPLIPLFWTSGDDSSGFQCLSGKPYWHFGRGICDICSHGFTSGVTPLPAYNANNASIAASCLPHMRVSAEVGSRDSKRTVYVPRHKLNIYSFLIPIIRLIDTGSVMFNGFAVFLPLTINDSL